MGDDFTHTTHPAVGGQTAHRLGLATSYGIDEAGLQVGLDAGLNYLFHTPIAARKLAPGVRRALQRDRERLVIATGPTVGFFGGSVRRGCESLLRSLGVDYLDVFQLFWLGKTSSFSDAVVDQLTKLKEEGKVRALGVSIHDRPRAGRLAEDSPLDLLMIRYNAAHPGAERDIFPHTTQRDPAIVAYTATAWRKLLKAPKGWDGPVPTAGDCYRFCLSSPNVHVTLTGPKTTEQLNENLRALEKGPLDAEEMAWMRAFGAAAHG